jgi:hypothetical protein
MKIWVRDVAAVSGGPLATCEIAQGLYEQDPEIEMTFGEEQIQ